MTISTDNLISFLTIACCVLDRAHLLAVAVRSLQDDIKGICSAWKGDANGK